MSNKKALPFTAEKIVIGILIVLMGINAIWFATSRYSGPLVGLIFYALITFLCWRRSHFQAGIIGGIIGFGIHAHELVFQTVGKLEGIDFGFFLLNIIFPIPLIYFSYKAQQHLKL